MRVRTHLRVAKIAAREFALARRAAVAFYFGSIVPDILPFYHPHYYKTSGNYVFLKLSKLSRKHTLWSYFMRGVMAHYVTDFCCSAHANGLGNVKEHVAYEIRLEKYAKSNYKQLKQKINNSEKITDLHEAINTYVSGEKFNVERDFCSAAKASAALLYCYTPAAEIRKRAFAFNFEIATPYIDELAEALTDAITDAINDVVRTNHGSV